MKSRKNTINGKVIVTGDVNELEPNEIMINEKLNEDGTISLDIKDISNSVKLEGADDDNGIFFEFVQSAAVMYNIHNNFYKPQVGISKPLLPGESSIGDMGAYIKVVNNKTLEYYLTSGTQYLTVLSAKQPLNIVIDDEVYEFPVGSYIHIKLYDKDPEHIIIMDSKSVKTYYEINKV